MKNAIIDSVKFRYRKTLPDDPVPGTHYWVEDENGTGLYFAGDDKKLYRLNSSLYETEAEEGWKTSQIGGIKAGLTKDNFKNMSISQVLDNI